MIIPSQDRIINNNKLEIKQIESLYNFQNIEGVINTTIFSDLKKLIPIPASSSIDEFGTKIKKLPIKRLENTVVNINHLKNKRINIEQDFRISNQSAGVVNLITPDDSVIPYECTKRITSGHHKKSCQEVCNYSVEEISNLSGARLLPELIVHKHSQTIVKKQTSSKTTFMSIAERKKELINHYNIHHNLY